MPFDEDLEEVFQHAIKPAAEAAGLECYRANHRVVARNIVADIIESIFEDDVLVADLTRSNPNVFYELGVAHAIGSKAVMICERLGENQKLPFDLKSYRVIFYKRSIEGIRTTLRQRLETTLCSFSTWSADASNPVLDFRPIKYKTPLIAQAELEGKIASLDAKVEALEGDLDRLREEQRRREFLASMIALSEVELRHLRYLAGDQPFLYEKRSTFIKELEHLRILGLISTISGSSIREIPESGDLKVFIALTEVARQFLDYMDTLQGVG